MGGESSDTEPRSALAGDVLRQRLEAYYLSRPVVHDIPPEVLVTAPVAEAEDVLTFVQQRQRSLWSAAVATSLDSPAPVPPGLRLLSPQDPDHWRQTGVFHVLRCDGSSDGPAADSLRSDDHVHLLNLVDRNAANEAARLGKRLEAATDAVGDLAEALGLASPPRRIEGLDVSHTAGAQAVASQVVFIDGQPAKAQYRKYSIRSSRVAVGHSDDYESLREVVRRRFRKYAPATAGTAGGLLPALREGPDFPDLLVVDGGKGQLRAVLEVLGNEIGISDTELPVISLAKRAEEVFAPGLSEPLASLADPNSRPMLLLRSIRDEAHRFAVSFHRQCRAKAALRSDADGQAETSGRGSGSSRSSGSSRGSRSSSGGRSQQEPALIPRLAGVKGLTLARQQALLDHLGGAPDAVDKFVDERDLLVVPGIGKVLAARILAVLRDGNDDGSRHGSTSSSRSSGEIPSRNRAVVKEE